jgi:putative protease
MEIEVENGISLPLSAVNAMRRDAISKLDDLRGTPPKRDFIMPILYEKPKNFSRHPNFCVSIDKINQLDDNILKAKPEYIYIPLEFINKENQLIKELIDDGQNICIRLPRIYFDSQKQDILDMLIQAKEIGIKTALCTNISQIDMLKFHDYKIRGDFSLNVFNSYTVKALSKMGLGGITLSYELMLAQIRDMRKNIDNELVVYGRLELMICENCIIKDSYPGCNKCKSPQFLKDRQTESFLIRGEYGCRNTVLNSHTLYLLDKLYDYDKLGITHFRLNFTDETAKQCGDIFLNAVNCEIQKPKVFTRGLYYKGVR